MFAWKSTTSPAVTMMLGVFLLTMSACSAMNNEQTPTTTLPTPQTDSSQIAPAPTASIIITEQAQTSLSATWLAAIGGADNYSVWLTIEGLQEPTHKTMVASPSYKFTGLTAGTSYDIYVQTFWNGISSSVTSNSSYTAPAPTASITITEQAQTSLSATWLAAMGGADNYSVWLTIEVSNKAIHNTTVVTNFYEFTGLTAGKSYNIYVQTFWKGLSSSVTSNSSYTAPATSASITIKDQTQTSFLATWVAATGGVDNYFVWLTGPKNATHNTSVTSTSYSFTGLAAGTNYSVQVRAVWRGLSSLVTSKSSNTAPGDFDVNTKNVTETTLNFSVIEPLDQHTYSFMLTGRGLNSPIKQQGQVVKFSNLVPGRLYRLEVSASFGGIVSLYPTIVMVNTRPDYVVNITLDKNTTTRTTLAISWRMPRGDLDNVTVTFYCIGPNRGSLTCSDVVGNSTTSMICADLDPGTFCDVEIQTQSGYQAGNIAKQTISKSTREDAPSNVSSLTSEGLSRAIIITWTKPSTPNGIIRKYKVILEDPTGACNNTYIVREIRCFNCSSEVASVGEACQAVAVNQYVTSTPNETEYQAFTERIKASFPDLVPGRDYTATVIAYTKCWGRTSSVHVWTDEEEPKGPPLAIQSSAKTNTLVLKWGRPRCEDTTGVITHYIVVIDYRNTTCYPAGEPIVNYFTTTSLTFILNNTLAYTNYTYRVSAATAIGQGPLSLSATQRTQAKEPEPVMMLRGRNITDTSVNLSWEAPCFPNGILSNYSISIINKDTNTTVRVTSTEEITTNLLGLLPYRNYTFRVAPFNHENLTGNNTDINITTQQAVPHIIENLTIYNKTDSSFTVKWSPPDVYPGVINYTVKSVDVYFNTSLSDETIWGFNSTELTVGTLRAYWNYSIRVEAATIAGINKSHSINVQTLETKPGPIAKLALFPETDVTKPRTVTVVWQEPKFEDKNGIIIGYVIRYGYNNTMMLQVNVSAETSNTVLPNLSTGYITVLMAAKTSVGEGDETYNYTDVKPGAPLKFNESNGQPLMQPSSHGVLDSERQISIMLPLRSFFCNDTNGKTIKWGLVVAETSITKGNEPYTGDVAGFNNTLETYRKWKDIKEADVIDPYIPTSSDWNPCNQTDTKLRNRRSVPDVVDMPFVIGADKDCDALDPNGFCNGQLAPGRSYSVRGFVCTEGGCTESEYSPGIKTDPDLTMPIVVGVLSGLVIVASVALVIVFMKRRQKACFAMKVDLQDDDNLKETESAEMSEITQQETSVHSFKPCSVPLSEFPAHVTNMHKDSNLLFADAFKMIKENSPALPSNMAKSEACRAKNRYSNILAFDHSRVKLLPLEDVEGSDFINANYIPGCKSKRVYIATQGPLPATFDDFWRMIWEQNVGVIVMLTKLVEKGRAKCDMYWPKLGEPVFYGDLVACTRSESTLPDYALRVIELQLKDQIRTVRQFCFLKWPDMGCPDHPYLLLDFVRAVRNEYSPELSRRGPMVVHCSAGVGRTGTFIALDNLLQYVKENDTVDIYNLVLQMRHSRCNMVQTEDQFIYIYECLKESMTVNTAEEEVIEEEPVYGNTSDNVYENMGFSQT